MAKQDIRRTLDECYGLLWEGEKQFEAGATSRALEAYELILNKAASHGFSAAFKPVVLGARHGRANIRRDHGKLTGLVGAISEYKYLYKAYQDLEDGEGFGTAALHLGASFEMQGQLGMAAGFYKIARSALSTFPKRAREHARAVLRLSTVHLKAGEVESGRTLVNEAKRLADVADVGSDMSLALQKEAIQFRAEGNLEAALSTLDDAKILLPPSGYGLVTTQFAVAKGLLLSSEPSLRNEALSAIADAEKLARAGQFGHQLKHIQYLQHTIEDLARRQGQAIFLPPSFLQSGKAIQFAQAEQLRDLSEDRHPDYLQRISGGDARSEATGFLERDLLYRQFRALVMKGGGVKGLAFMGAIPVLERKFRFSSYIGTSAGAIAAVLLAAGYTASEVESILRQKNFGDFFDGGWWRLFLGKLGAHSGARVSTWIEELVRGKLGLQRTPTMSDLPRRATVFAASTKDRSPVIFDTEGPNQDVPVGFAVRASAAIPGRFDPVPFNGDMLVDGGAVCNFAFDEIQRREPRRLLMGLYLKPEPHRPIASPFGVPRAALSVILAQRETEVVEENSASVAVIDPSPIATLTIPLSQGQQDLLMQAGQVAALELLWRNGALADREELTRAQLELDLRRARANARWYERIQAKWAS